MNSSGRHTSNIDSIEWEPKGRLDNISDKVIFMAFRMLKIYGCELNIIDYGDSFIIKNMPICKEGDVLNYYNVKDFRIDKTEKLGVCSNKFINNCSYLVCPFIVYSYIVYLVHKDIDYLKQIKERIKRNNNEKKIDTIVSNEYKFNLDIMYLDLTEVQLNIALNLSRRGLISVRNNMRSNKMVVDTYKEICNIENIKDMSNYIINDRIFGRHDKLDLEIDRETNNCGNSIRRYCNNQDCIIRIAAYIDYIITSGRIEEWLKEWNEYNSNEFCLNEQTVKNLVDKNILDNVIKNIHTDSYAISCIIQGNNGSGRYNIIEYINHELVISNRVTTAIYKKMSLRQFCRSIGKSYRFSNKGVNVSEFEQLSDDTLYVVDDIYNFFLYNKRNSEDYLHLIDIVSDVRESAHIIFIGNEIEVDMLLSIPVIRNLYGSSVIKLNDITAEQSYNIFVNNLNHELKLKLNEQFKEEYYKFIALSDNKIKYKNKKLAEYLANICNLENKVQIPVNLNTYSVKKTLDSLLEPIIGMNNIKQKIKEFERYNIFKKEAEAIGYKLPQSNMHMLFTGNPGTGKTTVARIVAHVLYEIGVLKEDKLIEVEKKDLEGMYVGQTAPKTSEVINRAIGGVLFIDEAYSLTSGIDEAGRGYGAEVIATLIKAMEDRKGEFVVIFAGYEKEMRQFIEFNSGIASRIGYTFKFNDYSQDELFDIFELKLRESNFKIEDNARDKIMDIIRYFYGTPNLGNGRFVDRILQNTLQKHALSFNSDNINIISEDDIPTINEIFDTMPSENNFRDIDIEVNTLEEIAYHEIGHLIVGIALGLKSDPIEITINGTNSGSLGHVKWGVYNKQSYSKKNLEYEISECLAGLASEKLVYGTFGAGGSSDLKKATGIAKLMISSLGMSESGLAYREIKDIDYNEVNKILDRQMNLAIEVIKKNKDVLKKIYNRLINDRRLSGDELKDYVKQIVKYE